MSDIDKVIYDLFTKRWSGNLADGPIEGMRAQLYKTLHDQVNGYWSGHTAYHIAVDGGFLIDAKRKRVDGSNRCEGKKLTALGVMFMERMR